MGKGAPTGVEAETGKKTSLLYNEFIVYDVAQVRQKYVLQVKFHFE